MILRRAFLKACSGIVAAPVLAQVSMPASAGHEGPATEQDAVALSTLPAAANPPDGALRIDGWDSAAGPDDAWVQINASWRATWR